jgi:hypothetical protein
MTKDNFWDSLGKTLAKKPYRETSAEYQADSQ